LTWCGNILQEATALRWKLDNLESPEPAIRDVARRGVLSAKDDDAKATLIYTLKTANLADSTVALIAEALGNFRGPEVTDSLIPFLTDHPTQIRVTAIQSIAKTQDIHAAEKVRPLLSSMEPPQVRLAAIRCLGELGSTDEDLQALKEVTGGTLQSEAAQAIRKVAARKLAFR
jgi:HEAT repeat protein